MTALEFIRLLLRRWYVVFIGGALTLTCGYVLIEREPLYYTQVEMVVLPPAERPDVNVLTRGPYSLTEIASLLVTEFNKGARPVPMNSADSTLYGEGVRSGEVVRLHNSGNQWGAVYDRPVIEVEVVDPNPERVEAEAKRIAVEIRQILDRQQDSYGIAATSEVSLRQAPDELVVYEINGSRSRTAAGTLLIGMWVTLVAAYVIDKLRRGRGVRRPQGAPEDVIPRREGSAPESAVPVGQG